MKNFTFLFLLFFISFSALAQVDFNWETQSISPDNNLQEMNIVNDTTTILVGYGKTFVKSADLGLTWDNVPVLDPLYDFIDLSINSSGIGYACARDEKVIDNSGEQDVRAHGLLLKTTDNGVSWTVTDVSAVGTGEDPELNPNAPGCFALHFHSVEVIDDNTAVIGVEWYEYEVSTGDRLDHANAFKTVDGGVSWTAITDNGRYPLAIEVADSSIYFGGKNHLLKTVAGSDVVTDIYPNLIAVVVPEDSTVSVSDITIVSETEIYVTTSVDGIFKTVDRGVTFTMLDGVSSGSNDMYKVNDSTLVILGTTSKSKVSTDYGATWADCNPGATCYEIGGVFNDSLYGLAKSKILKIAVTDLINGTYTWTEQALGDNRLQKMHIFDADRVLIIGNDEIFYVTTDAGISWVLADLPELFIYGAQYDFSDISTSGTASYASTRRFLQFECADGVNVYGHGLILKSTDYWQTWDIIDVDNIGEGTDPSLNPHVEGCYGLSPSEIECINADTAYVYVNWGDTIAGADNKIYHSRVFKTTDGGDTWTSITEDYGSSYVTSIYFIDDNTGFISGKTILLKTDNGGDSFTDLYPAIYEADESDSTKHLYDIHYIDENEWYIPSSTNGVFATADGGTTFTMFDGIGGGAGFYKVDTSTYIVLGSDTKSKITWDKGEHWTDCYPGSSVWGIGGVLNDSLVALAKTNLYKIALTNLAIPNAETDILTFVLAGQTGDAVINTTDHTITIEVTTGTDVSSLKPTLTLSESATVTPDTSSTQNFTSPVTYTVTAENGYTTQEWVATVTVSTAIEEVNSPDMIKIYPNPVKDVMYISNLENVEKMVIYSILGKTVKCFDSDNNTEIDLSMLNEGIYFISFYASDGSVSIKKFVKE